MSRKPKRNGMNVRELRTEKVQKPSNSEDLKKEILKI
jgi:hypothetical protein